MATRKCKLFLLDSVEISRISEYSISVRELCYEFGFEEEELLGTYFVSVLQRRKDCIIVIIGIVFFLWPIPGIYLLS